jgi:hypothetical protein
LDSVGFFITRRDSNVSTPIKMEFLKIVQETISEGIEYLFCD